MGLTVCLRLYAELQDASPQRGERRAVPLHFERPITVGELLRLQGVPLDAVELVIVNGESVGIEHELADRDLVSVFPVFESFDVTTALKLRSSPLRVVAFIADSHLGRLAKYLRLMGIDTFYDPCYDDGRILGLSRQTGRTILTKDRALVRGGEVTHALLIRASHPRRQLLEVMERVDLFDALRPFTRCLECNGRVNTVKNPSEQLSSVVAEEILSYYDTFYRCEGCGKVYWKGTHYERMKGFIAEILERGAAGPET